MAEAMINHYLVDKWLAYSAGVSPSWVNPRSVQVLQELGISTSDLRSKSVHEFLDRDDLDLVVTVCDHAKETCPVFFKPVEQVHIGIDDPVSYSNAPDETALEAFRKSREQVRELILGYLESRG